MRKLGVGLVLVLSGIRLQATTLWDQSNYLTSGIANQVFEPANVNFTSYLVDDVVVGAGGWTIDSVTGYFQGSTPPATGTAVLNIFSETGTLPTAGDDPTTGTTVNVTYTLIAGNQYSVTASALSIALTSGNYWIGLTPNLAFATFGQVFQYTTLSAVNGNQAAWINPGSGFGKGPDWQGASNVVGGYGDAAMLITGTTAPEPATMLGAAGVLLALGFLRRRRA